MFWLILVLMVLVVGAAALAALGAGGSLPDAERDRLAARLPQERPLGRADIDELRFPMALRGYRMDEVDDALDRMAAELSEREHRVAELENALAAALAAPGAAGAVATERGAAYEPTQIFPSAQAGTPLRGAEPTDAEPTDAEPTDDGPTDDGRKDDER